MISSRPHPRTRCYNSTVMGESGKAPPWSECAGLAPELRCWRLHIGNLKVDSLGGFGAVGLPFRGFQLVVPVKKRQDFIKQFTTRYSPATWNFPPTTQRYVLVMVDCFTRWTEAFPLPTRQHNRWRMRSLTRSFVVFGCLV